MVSFVGIGSTYYAPGNRLGTGILPNLIQKAGDGNNCAEGTLRAQGDGKGGRPWCSGEEEVSLGLSARGTPSSLTFSSAVSARCRRRDVIFTRLCSKAATRLA